MLDPLTFATGTPESIEHSLKNAKKDVLLPTFAKLLKTKPDYRAIEQQLFDTFSIYLDKLAE